LQRGLRRGQRRADEGPLWRTERVEEARVLWQHSEQGHRFDQFHFLNFKVCPNVERTRQFAANVLLRLRGSGSICQHGRRCCANVSLELSTAYDAGDDLDTLANFGTWTPDLGLRVRQKDSTTRAAISITELDFVACLPRAWHWEFRNYTRHEPYLAGRKSRDYSFQKARAFENVRSRMSHSRMSSRL